MVKRDGRVLASKDFPKDEVEYQDFETFIQVSGWRSGDGAPSDSPSSALEKLNASRRLIRHNCRHRAFVEVLPCDCAYLCLHIRALTRAVVL